MRKHSHTRKRARTCMARCARVRHTRRTGGSGRGQAAARVRRASGLVRAQPSRRQAQRPTCHAHAHAPRRSGRSMSGGTGRSSWRCAWWATWPTQASPNHLCPIGYVCSYSVNIATSNAAAFIAWWAHLLTRGWPHAGLGGSKAIHWLAD